MSRSNLSILIVDDEPAIRDVFKWFLAQRGHRVATCGSGHDARRHTRSGSFDVMILDIVLPDVSGIDLLDELRPGDPRAHFILLSGAPGLRSEIDCGRLGVFAYLQKPIRSSTLIEIVEAAGPRRPALRLVHSV